MAGLSLSLASLPPSQPVDPTRARLTGVRPAEWRTEAACAGQATSGLDPWHDACDPDIPTGDRLAAAELAIEVCRTCPVAEECLEYGLALLPLFEVHGILAGLMPRELQVVARERGLADRIVAQHGTRARRVAGCTCDDCRRAHAKWIREYRAKKMYAHTDRQAA